MENKNEKQLIFFKDLLFVALYQWKKILIVAIAFAVLLGAVGVLTGKDEATVGGMTLTPETQSKVEMLEAKKEFTEKRLKEMKVYMEESVMMTLDPYAVCTSGFHIVIAPLYDTPVTEATPIEADASALIRAYRSALVNSQRLNELAQQLDVDRKYLHEQIQFDTSTENTLGVLVRSNDMENAKAIADVLRATTEAGKETIAQTVKDHEITIILFESGPVYDSTCASQQDTTQKTLTNYENDLLSVETELKRYAPTQLVSGGTNPLLYAIVGAFLGACLVVGLAWVGHIGGSKIYSARVLENRTGVRVLGCVRGKKRNFIDRWLRKVEGRADNTQLDAVATDIRNRCKDAKQLLVMGCFDSEALTALTALLEKSGISCKLCPDPSVKADALEALPSCDAVVLAEVCGSSRYEAVEWAIQTVSDYEKALLGCVLIDG